MYTCSKDEPNIYKPKSPAGFGVLIILILIGLNVTALASGGPLDSFQVLPSVMLWAFLLSTVRGRWNLNTGKDKDDKQI